MTTSACNAAHAQNIYDYYKRSILPAIGVAIAGPSLSLPTWTLRVIGCCLGAALVAIGWQRLSALKHYDEDRERRAEISAPYKLPRIFIHLSIGLSLAVSVSLAFIHDLNTYQAAGIIAGIYFGVNVMATLVYLPRMRRKYGLAP